MQAIILDNSATSTAVIGGILLTGYLGGATATPRARLYLRDAALDPKRALSFYERAVGFTHRTVDSPAGPYHILSKDGVDRGGVTGYLPAGASPHWLPIVKVDDVDAAVDRARKLGARIPRPPEDMPGIGRLGLLEDPTGAVLAVMKLSPRAQA